MTYTLLNSPTPQFVRIAGANATLLNGCTTTAAGSITYVKYGRLVIIDVYELSVPSNIDGGAELVGGFPAPLSGTQPLVSTVSSSSTYYGLIAGIKSNGALARRWGPNPAGSNGSYKFSLAYIAAS